MRQLRTAHVAVSVENAQPRAKLADGPVADPTFRPKGWYTTEDIRRELAPAANETHLRKRLGLTGTRNTRLAVRRKMEEAGLGFWFWEDADAPDDDAPTEAPDGRSGNSE